MLKRAPLTQRGKYFLCFSNITYEDLLSYQTCTVLLSQYKTFVNFSHSLLLDQSARSSCITPFRQDETPEETASKFGLIPRFYKLSLSEGEDSSHWMLDSVPMQFEQDGDILIDTEEFLHDGWVYLGKIYLIYLYQDNLDNSVLIADLEQKRIFKVDLETKPEFERTNYSLVGNDNYKLYIFGGVNPEGDALNTVETFDVAQYQWQKVETRGTAPSPRQGHSAVIVSNNMFVFGGTSDTDKDDPTP